MWVCVRAHACLCGYVHVCVFLSISLWPAFVVATLAHALVTEYLHGNSDVEELLFFNVES